MTLLIAAKAGPGLRPKGTTFIFEPGIVIAADPRLSFADGTSIDDGLKLGVTGPQGICGMASDSIDIPSRGFHDFDILMEQHPDISSIDAVSELQRLLKNAHGVISSRLGRANLVTNVFFAHSDPSTARLSLYRLDSGNDFVPKLRDGFNAAGSHASWVMESFERIKSEYPNLMLHPFDGFPGNRVTLKEGLAPLVSTLIHSALLVAAGEEAARGRQQAIGGAVQSAIISAKGPEASNPVWFDTLKAWQVHENRLQ